MSINLTDELLAKTKKGKIASAKQVFLNGDKENLQQIGEKTNQLVGAFEAMTPNGGASKADAVSYKNTTSGMTAVTAQGAIDELAAKKFDKESILQESGDAEDKVMSQKAVSTKLSDLFNILHVTSNDEYLLAFSDKSGKFAFGIKRKSGDFDFGIGVPSEIKSFILQMFAKAINDSLKYTDLQKQDLSSQTDKKLLKVYEDLGIRNEDGYEKTGNLFKIVSNKEYLIAFTDVVSKLLFSISKKNGFLGVNGLNINDTTLKVGYNKEYLFVLSDLNDNLLLGIRRTGKFHFGDDSLEASFKFMLDEALSNYSAPLWA